ncbi:MAG TPA: C69 family dipeptidase [Candidatus Tidjanibacter gallistercoris]|nr:C69 family dipeptidase [Candidatus Tidjanibacter gallistercoris]
MKRFLLAAGLLAVIGMGRAEACTSFIITKGASTDGSAMVSYAADSHQLYGALYKYDAPRRGYKPGTMMPVYEWDTGRYLGDIPQAARTYSTVGNMNDRQLIIAETTYGGRPELVDPDGSIDYGSLIYITLQRAATAREAIATIVELANTYGYASSGESFSIVDKDEAWIFEMIGKGSKIVDGRNVNKGIVWVARRIPDGYICAHANQARITQFPLDDPENCLYAPDVISFAREMGYYEGSDADFSFSDVYAPLEFGTMRGCEARVWSFFKTFAPGMDAYLDYAMGYNPANRMPLWVKPAEKISPKQVFDAMRDHFEGTPMDMTADIGAGGSACPYRWRPMEWEWEGETYVNERATATQQTGFWFVAQARDYLPDTIGGVLWFGVDDTATSALTPIYCGTTQVPWCFSEENGSMLEYSDTAAFWIFNRIAQFAYLRYDIIGKAVRERADAWENDMLLAVQEFDEKVMHGNMSHRKMVREATRFSVENARRLFDRWTALDRYLMVKYIDGNVKVEDANGFVNNGYDERIPETPEWPGYTDAWKEAVVRDNGDVLRVVE